MAKKIIFGGGFDPIHLGHLNMASEASRQLDADVIFVPAPISVWKSSSVRTTDKVAMVQLAIRDYPRFTMSTFEIDSGKTTNFSIDTVRHFVSCFPEDEFYYLIGTDHVNRFHRWKEAETLSKMAHIIFFARPGFVPDQKNIEKYNIQEISGPSVDTSSMEIRTLQSSAIPLGIRDYIEKHSLYYMSKMQEYLGEKRLNHSLSVAHLAYDVMAAAGLENPGRGYIAGLLHDVGKEIPCDQKIEVLEKTDPAMVEMPPFSYHQFVGAYIAEKEFGILDREILDAIRYHATGNADMSLLARIIYASDKIEPTRGFDSSELIRAMKEDPVKGFVKVLKANREYLDAKGKSENNPLTSACYAFYLGKK